MNKLIAYLILSCCVFACKLSNQQKSTADIPNNLFGKTIEGLWHGCGSDGSYYELYFTDSFAINTTWIYTYYFLSDEQVDHAIRSLHEYEIHSDSIFFYDFIPLWAIGKMEFCNENKVRIYRTFVDSLRNISGLDRELFLERLPDSIVLPPMNFEQNKHKWQDWWDEYSFSEFKYRAIQANCIDIFSDDEIDSLKTEFLEEWNDTSLIRHIFELNDSDFINYYRNR